MRKYLIYVMFILGCTNTGKDDTASNEEIFANKTSESSVDTVVLRSTLNNADSVILASHYSPNEPIRDERTGKYLPRFEVVENGKLNESIVQERKKLVEKEIKELGSILCSPAVADSIATGCFQPRNGVFVYNSGKLLYVDVCFDCYAAAVSRNWNSDIIFDNNKYKRLLQFYIKHGFKYML